MGAGQTLDARELPAAELTDAVVRLRPLLPGDAADMAAATRAEADAYVLWGPVAGPIDERRAALFVADYERSRQRGQKIAFALLDGRGGFVGSVLLIASGHDEAELAYWVRAEARGRGYATRALTLLSDWALGLHFRRVWLEIEPHNRPSARVAVKAGFLPGERRVSGIGGVQVEVQIFVRSAAPAVRDSAAAAREAGPAVRDSDPTVPDAAPAVRGSAASPAGRMVSASSDPGDDGTEDASHTTLAAAGLPPGYQIRRPERADLEAVIALFGAAESLDCGEPDTTPGDVLADWEGLPHFDLRSDAWLVTSSAGQVVAYAWEWDERPDEQLVADFIVLPGHRRLGIEDALLELTADRAAEHASRTPSGTARLGMFSLDTNRDKLALFEANGFMHVRTFERMTIDLKRVRAEPSWPAGIEVRSFRRGRDEAPVHAAIQESFSDHYRDVPLSLPDWEKLMFANPELDLDLWRVAWDGDQVAGALRSFLERSPGAGYVDELGVRAAWRGRGVGTALLVDCFVAMRQRGMQRVVLGVDSTNTTGAHLLYRRIGMTVERRIRFFEKPVRAAATRADGSVSGVGAAAAQTSAPHV
jgi:mycothiol synthase